jgi:dipeptidyl aminopeptidase/acylaminoacyl peptidase
MRCQGLILFFLTTLTLAPQTLTPQQKRTLTPEDLVDVRSVYDANVSPDGKRIAFVVSEPGDSNKPLVPRDQNIWTVPVDGSEPARQFAFSPKRENTPRWSADGHWLAFLSDRGGDGQTQIWLMRADGGEAEKLTSAKAGVDSYKWSPDGQMIAFLARDVQTDEEQKRQEARDDAIHIDHDYKYMRLWIIGLSDHKSALVTRENIEVTDFDWSPDTQSFAIAFTSVPGLKDFDDHLALVRRSDGEPVARLADNVNWSTPNIRWSPDGKVLLFFEMAPSRDTSWMSLIESTGGQVRSLLKDYPGTFLSCEWAPDSNHVIAEAIVGTRAKLLRIDVGTGEVGTLADVNGYLNDGAAFTASADGRILAFVNEKADSPGDVWSLAAGQSPRQLTNFNPQMTSLRLGNVRDISWTNRKNGQVLHGILVTPADFRSGQPYPTVVEAHQGTAAWWFGWQGSWWQWAHLLASNGYVVFLPNPRGVLGQGWELAGNIHTWGGGAFDDTMSGVDSLIDQKIADPNRLGIGGWSNGGFMTAWAITHTNRFKAAVPFAAPVDFSISWGASDLGRFLEANFGGTPLHARQQYEVRSPFYFVENCKTPTLILHGETDPIVPIAQAYGFYHALKSLGIETEMVVYPREGHSIEERAHQIDFQKRVLAWFDKHLK